MYQPKAVLWNEPRTAGGKKVRGAVSALAGADRTFLDFFVLFDQAKRTLIQMSTSIRSAIYNLLFKINVLTIIKYLTLNFSSTSNMENPAFNPFILGLFNLSPVVMILKS